MYSLSIIHRRTIIRQARTIMSQPTRLSYSAAAGSADIPKPPPKPASDSTANQSSSNHRQHASNEQQSNRNGRPGHKRTPSPSYAPNTSSAEEAVYVLTLLTDAKHHRTLTETRKKYFPPRLNRLDAHITLFHALPGSLLEESIKPTLREISSKTTQFHLLAATPFRLNKGIAIGLPKSSGGDDARQVHQQLKAAWSDFLSRQDAGGFAAHYTIMNKVDDEKEVQKAFEQVQQEWKGCHGTVLGLSLFKYDRGNWVHNEDFKFAPSQ
jgi:2'-5' RNA ligase